MAKLNKKYISFGLVLVCIIIFAIWVQSCFPVSISRIESGSFLKLVKGMLEPIFGDININGRSIRKIAHAVEYFILGLAIAIVIINNKPRRRVPKMPTCLGRLCDNNVNALLSLRAVICMFIVFVVACIDEFIQIFSGRGSRFSDVMLDFVAGLVAILLILIIRMVIEALSSQRTQ